MGRLSHLASRRTDNQIRRKRLLGDDGLAERASRSCARLGARGTEHAWTQGWEMALDRSIAYALGESEPETDIDPGPLSRREREVATLVAAGMTNRQIGELLFQPP